MKPIDLPFYVELGAAINSAEKVDPEGRLFDALVAFYGLRNFLNGLSNGQHARVSAAAHSLAALGRAIEQFEQRHFRDERGEWKNPDAETKAQFEILEIISKIRDLKTILIAELRTSSSFAVVGSGIFDVDQLVNEAHKAIDDEIRLRLSDTVCAEIDSAGKCLAFNLPTAAAFHSMRAIERVVKRYLGDFLSLEEIEKLNNWGQYIAAMEKLKTQEDGPSEEAIALIRQVKDIYRNPVIRPDRVLNYSESSIVFHSMIAAVVRIASEFRSINVLATKGLASFLDGTSETVANPFEEVPQTA